MPDAAVDIILGLVQGLTEFLPVSSSGHLVVVPAVFGWDEPSLSFDLLLHVATLLAVVAYFRIDLVHLTKGAVGRGPDPRSSRRLIGFLAVATLPTAVAGLALEDVFERLFDEPLWACLFWVCTAGMLVLGERLHRNTEPAALTTRRALLIGAAQAVALAPGISRSGATIVAGMAVGLSRTEAARFAFLLAIPAIAGGGLTLIPDIADGSLKLTPSVLGGFAVAAASGYFAVAALLRFVRARSLAPFSVYLLIVAPLAALALAID